MAFATPADFLQRYDYRFVGDLVSDAGARVTESDLLTNGNLTALLEDATGAINAALYVGNRYTPEQLANLSTTAQSFLKRLCSGLTLVYLKQRRGKFNPETDGALLKELNQVLQDLRDGNDLLLAATDDEAPASVMELSRPRLIGKKRAQTIRNQTRNYYPANPDYDSQVR